MRSKILYAAEKRGLKIQNDSSSSLNHTFWNIKTPNYASPLNLPQNSNILVSDPPSQKNADLESKMQSQNMQDFLNRFSLAKSNVYTPTGSNFNFPINSMLINNRFDQKLNLKMSINYTPQTHQESNMDKIQKNRIRVDKAIREFVRGSHSGGMGKKKGL
jgi:hypothetical protein